MDSSLESLPEPARGAMATALAAPLEEWRTVQSELRTAFEAVGWPQRPDPIPLADQLTPHQRSIATLLAGRPGTYVGARFAIPMSQWNRRRWLGLDPPSALESTVSFEGQTACVWQHALTWQKDADALALLLSSLAPARRHEVLLDLLFHAYRFYDPGVERELTKRVLAMDMGDAAAHWAPDLADRFLDVWSRPVTDRGNWSSLDFVLRFAAFLPLVRGGAAIAPRWDVALPLGLGPWREWMHACVDAVPADRRDKALDEAFARELDATAVVVRAVELLPTHCSKWMARQVLKRARRHPTMTEGEVLAALEPYTAQVPDIEALLAKRRAKQKPVALKVKRVYQPASPEDVFEALQPQLAIAGEGADLFEPDARLAILDVDEARSDRRYTVWLHHVDAGIVFRGRSLDIVGRILQFGVECGDDLFADGLTAALRIKGFIP